MIKSDIYRLTASQTVTNKKWKHLKASINGKILMIMRLRTFLKIFFGSLALSDTDQLPYIFELIFSVLLPFQNIFKKWSSSRIIMINWDGRCSRVFFQWLSVKWLTPNCHLKFELFMSSLIEFICFSSCIFALLNPNLHFLPIA